jgi:FKBP-type peptidyl-prolyl cis-trans isomerase FkpA
MKKGGTYRLKIPPALGYADKDVGNGEIPANSTLLFDVQILEIMPEAQLRQLMMQQQMMMQGGPGGAGGAPGGPGGPGEGPPQGE